VVVVLSETRTISAANPFMFISDLLIT
jgi:hypothetical protein